MAKDKEWDDNFDDFDMGFEFGDFEDEVPEGRKPAERAKKVLSEGMKSTTRGAFDRTTLLVSRAMPNTSMAVRDVQEVMSGGKAILSDFTKDVAKTVDIMKMSTRRLLPSAKKLIPQKIYDKVDKALTVENKIINQKKLQEEERESIIADAISKVFVKEQEANAAEREEGRVDKLIDRKLSISQFSSLNKVVSYMASFMDTSLSGYMKKSIELKYKHLFVAQDTFKAVQASALILETKLEAIKHNTGLPDIQKVHATEMMRGAFYNKMFGKGAERFSEFGNKYLSGVLKNIKTNVTSRISDNLSMVGGMADQGSEMYQMMQEMEEMSGNRDTTGDKIAQSAAGIGGGFLGKKLANKHVQPLLKLLAPFIRGSEDVTDNFRTKGILKLNDLKEEWSTQGGAKGFLADLMPYLENNVNVHNVLEKHGDQAMSFDKATRTSIVEIIPGWLGKISKGIRDLIAGKDTEEEVYDITKRDFVKVSAFKTGMSEYLYGSDRQKAENVSSGLGTISSAYELRGGGDDVSFDEVKKEVSTVLINHGLHLNTLRPNAIKAFAFGEPLNEADENYIYQCFQGVENKEKVAMVLTKALFSGDTVDETTLKSINNSIISKIKDDEYKLKFSNLFETHGLRRFFKEDLDESGRVTKESIRKHKMSSYDSNVDDIDRNIQSEGLSHLNTIIQKDAEHQFTKEKLGKYSNQYTDKFLQSGLVDIDKTKNLIEQYKQRPTSYTPELDNIQNTETEPTPTFGRDRSFRTQQNLQSPIIANVDLSGVFPKPEIFEGLTSVIANLTESLNKKHDLSSGEGENKDLSVVNQIYETLSKFIGEKTELDYNILDYLIQINDNVASGGGGQGSLDSGEKKKFGFLSTIGKRTKSSAGQFKNFMTTKWKGLAGGGGKRKLLTTAAGAAMFGPLGAALGFDAANGFKGSKALLKGAGNVASTGYGLAKTGVGAGLGFGKTGFGFAKDKFNIFKPKAISNFFKAKKKVGEIKDTIAFFDIFKEGDTSGSPILTGDLQKEGKAFYSNGKKVKSSWMINEPVLDENGTVLISQEDLDNGIVNINGTLVYKTGHMMLDKVKEKGKSASDYISNKVSNVAKGKSSLNKVFNTKTLGAGLGALAGGPLGAFLGYKAGGLFTGAGDKVKDAGKGIFNKIFKRGKDEDSDTAGGQGSLKKSQYKGIISRLDKIIENTKKPKTIVGDTDGDGDRDNSWLDRMKNKQKVSDRATVKGKDGKESTSDEDKSGSGLFGMLGGLTDKVKKGGAGLLGMLGLKSMLGGSGAATAAKSGGLLSRAASLGGRGLAAGGRLAAGAGRLAMTGAAALPGVASTVAGAVSTGASAAMAGAGSLATAATGVLAAIPVAGWIALGVVAAGAGAYGLYKYLKPSKGNGELLKERIKIYRMGSVTDIDDVRKLENRVNEFITKEEGPLTDKEINKYLKRYKIPVNDYTVGAFKDWLAHSFIPQFGTYLKVLERNGKTYKDSKKIDIESPEYQTILKQMVSDMKSVEVSGPSFSEIANMKKPSEQEDKDKQEMTDSGDSEKRNPIAQVAQSMDKNNVVTASASMTNISPAATNITKSSEAGVAKSIEQYRPKDDLFSRLLDNNVSQLTVLTNIHTEIQSIRNIADVFAKEYRMDKLNEEEQKSGGLFGNLLGNKKKESDKAPPPKIASEDLEKKERQKETVQSISNVRNSSRDAMRTNNHPLINIAKS